MGAVETALALPNPPKFSAGFNTYLSSFTYRYGSDEMRKIWSQQNFWQSVRDVWIAVAETQQQAGLVTKEQIADLKRNRENISPERIWQLERNGIGHDVIAATLEYREVAPIGGAILHQGLTSEDVLGNAETMQIHQSYGVLRPKLRSTLVGLANLIEQHKNLVCNGLTHLQVAEPITMGYRIARYAQNLLKNYRQFDHTLPHIVGKGIKGPVGTKGSLEELLKGTTMSAAEHEKIVMEKLGLPYATISGQTYPRTLLFDAEGPVAATAQSLHNFALDVQILQCSYIDEVAEPKRKGERSSSSMVHKRNPNMSEAICSLGEAMPGHLTTFWIIGAFETLERTLRDSAVKRDALPASFLALDDMLTKASRLAHGLEINEASVNRNLRMFAPFFACEPILSRFGKSNVDRQDVYDWLYEHAQEAQRFVRAGKPNPLKRMVLSDPRITDIIGKRGVNAAFREVFDHVGDAKEACEKFLREELYPTLEAA